MFSEGVRSRLLIGQVSVRSDSDLIDGGLGLAFRLRSKTAPHIYCNSELFYARKPECSTKFKNDSGVGCMLNTTNVI